MEKILLIDDEPKLLRLLSQMLRAVGYVVSTASDGVEALKLAHNDFFNLVITDLIMPDKDGFEMIMDLRRHAPATKIIAMSGGGRNGPERYLPTARLLGARYTLAKPFSQKELLDAVAQVLSEGQG